MQSIQLLSFLFPISTNIKSTNCVLVCTCYVAAIETANNTLLPSEGLMNQLCIIACNEYNHLIGRCQSFNYHRQTTCMYTVKYYTINNNKIFMTYYIICYKQIFQNENI